ncbi:MAG: hypothetical protein IAF02_10990 [Anaerolineae bacterium]|nr:hypothetical protein [Anaerolineae bacterium]
MSEDAENTTTWQSDPRLRYVVPVIVVLGLILLILALAASCNGRDNDHGLKPFRPTRTPFGDAMNSEVVVISFTDLNGNPDAYKNQRIRVTGDKVTIPPQACRLYTGPVFTWGLIAEDLQLNALGYDELAKRLPDGLTMTVEGVWRQYNGPLGCGKEPSDGIAWYLQVERIISPNPLPLMEGAPFATIQVLLGTRPSIDIMPFETSVPETAVTPDLLTTPTPDDTGYPVGTFLPPTTLTPLVTATIDPLLPTATLFPGLTPSATPLPGVTRTEIPPGSGGTDPTATPPLRPSATVPGFITQTPAPTIPGYPGPSTPEPTRDPYS